MKTNGTGKPANGHVHIPAKKITKVISLTKGKQIRPRSMAVWTFLFTLSNDPHSPHPRVEMSIFEIAKALNMGKTTIDRCFRELVKVGLLQPIYRVGSIHNPEKTLSEFRTFKEAREATKTRKFNMFEAHYQL